MQSPAVAFGPSEGRSSELSVMRNEVAPLNAAAGFVIGGLMSGLLWCLIALGVIYAL